MFRYETHLHTSPVSRCAQASVRESLEFYKKIGFAGVFITNHFIDGNIGISKKEPYDKRIEFYFSDYERALEMADETGIQVLNGLETTIGGSDFLVYGLDKEWFLSHPENDGMNKRDQLELFMENGALVIQAHPFREANYIDHIRLYPRSVHGAEIINACRTDFENGMAEIYAKQYGLLPFAGSDNHKAAARPKLAGLEFKTPLKDERDFVKRVLAGEINLFSITNDR